MRSTDTLVIGAGQAGLSLSRHLTHAGHRHDVLERGRVGERWRSERWDSLRLLTPNWLNRLDGGAAHDDRDGFLARDDFVRYLGRYRASFAAPVHEHVTVTSVEQADSEFRIGTEAGSWRARNVVIATGDAALPAVPAAAATAPGNVLQLHSSRYRNPGALPAGGVLVVGAGPSGQQIAAELRRAGREVVLAVGGHARSVRRYRGRDTWHWLKELGDLERTIDEVPAPEASRRAPSFTLTGANGGEQLDLAVLERLGVAVTGRLEGFDGARAFFAGDLPASVAHAEQRMLRLLDRVDEHLERTFGGTWAHDADRPPAVQLPEGPGSVDLSPAGVTTVIWATGYRREYPWLHVPALDPRGEIDHERGVTPIPGLYALGLRFQYRRSSHFIGGVGADAAFIAERIANTHAAPAARLRRRAAVRASTAAACAG
jgi:putative flavoprotein involved in K+ transport